MDRGQSQGQGPVVWASWQGWPRANRGAATLAGLPTSERGPGVPPPPSSIPRALQRPAPSTTTRDTSATSSCLLNWCLCPPVPSRCFLVFETRSLLFMLCFSCHLATARDCNWPPAEVPDTGPRSQAPGPRYCDCTSSSVRGRSLSSSSHHDLHQTISYHHSSLHIWLRHPVTTFFSSFCNTKTLSNQFTRRFELPLDFRHLPIAHLKSRLSRSCLPPAPPLI